MSQEKLQTMVMQKFWGVIEVYYGIVQVVNRVFSRDVTAAKWCTQVILRELSSIIMQNYLLFRWKNQVTDHVIENTLLVY